MTTPPSELDKQNTQKRLDSVDGRNSEKNSDYLSYKAQETTEEQIVKGQEESQRKSISEAAEHVTPPPVSTHSSSDQNDTNNSSTGSGLTESEQISDPHLNRTNSGKNNPLPRKSHSKKPAHSRSQSHTKVNTRLSSSANANKPYLNRSKSTDGIIPKARPSVKRNNRSNTKLNSLLPLTKTSSNGSLSRALGALQPLTKTVSRESLKQNSLRKITSNGSGKGSQSALAKTDSSQSLKSNKSNNSLKSLTPSRNNSRSNNSLKGLTGIHPTGLKTSTKRGKAILKLNEDDTYNEYEDLSEGSEDVEPEEPERGVERMGRPDVRPQREPVSETAPDSEKSPDFAPDSGTASNKSNHSTQTFSAEGTLEDEPQFNKNLYGGSFLLSQSTGMTRKIEPSKEMMGFPSDSNNGDSSKTGSEKSSGIVFRPRAEAQSSEPTPKISKAAVTHGSYQPNQTIFSNLQRNDSKYLSTIKQQRQHGSANGAVPAAIPDSKRDFSSYLNQPGSSNHNIETRTQQRLWLQRENSLLDVSTNMDVSRVGNFSNLSLNKLMFAHNYNNSTTNTRETPGSMANWLQEGGSGNGEGHPTTPSEGSVNAANMLYLISSGQQNSIQSRTEFERLNREYVNVRRHLNPVAESLSRVEKHVAGQLDVKKHDKKNTYAATTNANSFKEFAPSWEKKEGESVLMLNKLWQEAIIQSSSSTLSARILQQEQQRQFHVQNLQNQQNSNQRIGEYASQGSVQDLIGTNQMKQNRRTLGDSVPKSTAPTTRAVKMAQAAPEQTPRL